MVKRTEHGKMSASFPFDADYDGRITFIRNKSLNRCVRSLGKKPFNEDKIEQILLLSGENSCDSSHEASVL